MKLFVQVETQYLKAMDVISPSLQKYPAYLLE